MLQVAFVDINENHDVLQQQTATNGPSLSNL